MFAREQKGQINGAKIMLLMSAGLNMGVLPVPDDNY